MSFAAPPVPPLFSNGFQTRTKLIAQNLKLQSLNPIQLRKYNPIQQCESANTAEPPIKLSSCLIPDQVKKPLTKLKNQIF